MASSSPVVKPEPAGGWLAQRERGNVAGMRFVLAYTRLGRRPSHALVRAIAGYYTLHGVARGHMVYRASRAYLRRMFPRVTTAMVHRHLATFAECALDRMYFAAERLGSIRVTRSGWQHIDALAATGRGAMLLGAHLGSFEALRYASRMHAQRLSILAHFANARKITAFLRAAAPEVEHNVIPIEPGNPGFVLRVRECIEAGELVAVLGDRTGLGEESVAVPFLGAPARFPTGPYALASVLECPIYLTFGLYHRPDHYALYCQPFADVPRSPRHRRKAVLTPYVAAFARKLEFFCRLAPYNWFNFFDFWEEMKTDDGT